MSAVTLALALSARRARAAETRQLIVYWVSGGWDPTITFDPHLDDADIASDPSATLAIAGGIPIADAASRPSVRRFFERWGSRSIVFNGLSVDSISHETCTRLMLTGRRTGRDMDIGTRVAAGSGADLQLPHVVLGGPRFGGEHGALVSLISPTFLGVASGTLPTARDAEREDRVRAWLDAELAARGELDAHEAVFAEGLGRLSGLEALAREFSSVDLGVEEGRRSVALRLLGAGVTRSVLTAASVASLSQWDSHLTNLYNQDANFELTFSHLDAWMDALAGTTGPDGTALSETTELLVLSEMGRQPRLNRSEGKDHWPVTSALLVSARCEGGRVIGGTDGSLAARAVDLATGELDDRGVVPAASNLVATMVEGFDLDPAEWADGETPIGGVWRS
jgi:uncharacterized protein (DUF1501 family)